MSKDQLGWEQILSGEAPQAEQTPAATPPPAPQPEPRANKQTAPDAPAEVSYAKKNWGALNLATAAAPPPPTRRLRVKTAPEPVESEAESANEEPSEPQQTEPEVYSVSQLNRQIRESLEGQFALLWVKGEISNFKAHTSGHFYFSLKDAKAQISAVMFRGYNGQLKFRPEDGMEVLIRGKVTVYEPRGNYQIFCEMMEPVGAGALQKAFEQLKKKLEGEGLFSQARKRALPALPQHIAIVTSPTGAAIRDMLHVLNRRFKSARVTIIPCKVQGAAAAGEIVTAIALANRLTDVDVMIVGRGGGSIEDLWAFNEEKVARAIAASKIPVVSAVGHEIDFTIADFVADLRAPTPSAAAELVVKNAGDLLERVSQLSRGLRSAILSRLQTARQAVLAESRRLLDPKRRIQDSALRCDELVQRLHLAIQQRLQTRRLQLQLTRQRLGSPLERLAHRREGLKNLRALLNSAIRSQLQEQRQTLSQVMAVLDSLSPLRVLERGYAMVWVDGRVLTRASDAAVADTIEVRLSEGSLQAEVKSKKN